MLIKEAQEVMDRLNARRCACYRGSTCDVSHDPAQCECKQCTEAERKIVKVWCATYCNKAHRTSDGKPIKHECRIIPPRAIAADMAGNAKAASQIMSEAPIRMMQRGVRQ